MSKRRGGRVTCTVPRCGRGARVRRIHLVDPDGNHLEESTRLCDGHWEQLNQNLAREMGVTVTDRRSEADRLTQEAAARAVAAEGPPLPDPPSREDIEAKAEEMSRVTGSSREECVTFLDDLIARGRR